MEFLPQPFGIMVKHHAPQEATHDPHLVGVVAAADQFCVRRGIVLGAAAARALLSPQAIRTR